MNYNSDYINVYFKKGIGKTYNSRINNKFENFIFELEKHFLREIFSGFSSGDKNYMDFACGTGRIIKFIAQNFKFKNYLGIDISPEMIERAKKDINNPKVELRAVDILEKEEVLNIPKADVVTSFRLVLNMEPRLRNVILKGLRELMTDDSFLIINNHMNRYSVLGVIAYFCHHFLGMPLKGRNKPDQRSIINTMSYAEMRKLLEDCGFKIVKVYRFCLLPGHKRFLILPQRFLFPLEKFLSRIPIMNLFSKDQIYVCEKIKRN